MYLLKISNVLKEARSEEAFVRNRRRASRSRSPFLSSQSGPPQHLGLFPLSLCGPLAFEKVVGKADISFRLGFLSYLS